MALFFWQFFFSYHRTAFGFLLEQKTLPAFAHVLSVSVLVGVKWIETFSERVLHGGNLGNREKK